MTYSMIRSAAEYFKKKIGTPPKFAVVLGSGLAADFERLPSTNEVSFAEIPHFPKATVKGHRGSFRVVSLSGKPVLLQMGRVHYYEGHSTQEVVLPLRMLKLTGVEDVLITNAAGGLNAKMAAGDFMAITDQINLTGQNPLIGANIEEFGPRFPDMSEVYSKALTKNLTAALARVGVRFHEGVYCGVTGPCYESAAEVRHLGQIGGSAVGMSTVLEAIAARHCGLRIAGLSAITNLGTGLSMEALTHEDVQLQGAKLSANLHKIVEHLVSL